MTIRLSTYARNKGCQGIVNAVDEGNAAPNGYIELRSGNRPNTPEDVATGTLLVKIELNNPAFGAPVNGRAPLNSTIAAIVLATGTIGWFRIYSRSNQAMWDGKVTLPNDPTGDLFVRSLDAIAGGSISIGEIMAVLPI